MVVVELKPRGAISREERCVMSAKRNERDEVRETESVDRRRFLRNVMGIGGALGALALSAASQKVLAKGLRIDPRDLQAARRAQQAEGLPDGDGRVATAEEPSPRETLQCNCRISEETMGKARPTLPERGALAPAGRPPATIAGAGAGP